MLTFPKGSQELVPKNLPAYYQQIVGLIHPYPTPGEKKTAGWHLRLCLP
jgi:hypothetical protein